MQEATNQDHSQTCTEDCHTSKYRQLYTSRGGGPSSATCEHNMGKEVQMLGEAALEYGPKDKNRV